MLFNKRSASNALYLLLGEMRADHESNIASRLVDRECESKRAFTVAIACRFSGRTLTFAALERIP
jgi:hypothetical protein